MKVFRLLLASALLLSCTIFPFNKKSKTDRNYDIRGDCASVMNSYQKALYERDGALKELDYSVYYKSRYGDFSESKIEELEIKYEKARNNVDHYEQEVLPLSCEGFKKTRR